MEWLAYLGAFRHLRRLNLANCRAVNNSAIWYLSGTIFGGYTTFYDSAMYNINIFVFYKYYGHAECWAVYLMYPTMFQNQIIRLFISLKDNNSLGAFYCNQIVAHTGTNGRIINFFTFVCHYLTQNSWCSFVDGPINSSGCVWIHCLYCFPTSILKAALSYTLCSEYIYKE